MSLLLILSLPSAIAALACIAGYTVQVLYPRLEGTDMTYDADQLNEERLERRLERTEMERP